MVEKDNDRSRSRQWGFDVGRSLVFGGAVGTVVFAFTQDPVWIALGASLGIVLGSLASMARWR